MTIGSFRTHVGGGQDVSAPAGLEQSSNGTVGGKASTSKAGRAPVGLLAQLLAASPVEAGKSGANPRVASALKPMVEGDVTLREATAEVATTLETKLSITEAPKQGSSRPIPIPIPAAKTRDDSPLDHQYEMILSKHVMLFGLSGSRSAVFYANSLTSDIFR